MKIRLTADEGTMKSIQGFPSTHKGTRMNVSALQKKLPITARIQQDKYKVEVLQIADDFKTATVKIIGNIPSWLHPVNKIRWSAISQYDRERVRREELMRRAALSQ